MDPRSESVRVLVSDGDPDRLRRLSSALGGLAPTVESLGRLGAPEPGPRGRGVVGVVAVDEPDDEACLAALRRWPSPYRAVVLHAAGVGAWSPARRSRVLLACRGTLLDRDEPGFESRLVRAAADATSRVAHQLRLDREAAAALVRGGLVGASEAMIQVGRGLVAATALSPASVLVLGPTGVGKELVARAVHQLDPARRQRPLVALNCAAMTPALAESDLFGHRRGAFTGAEAARAGAFRAAAGGVLFLDEVGELPPALQAKLLRALQEGVVQPVGEDREVPVDVRVVAATNQPLERLLDGGGFRRDLYHRLAVVTIRVPPLAERIDDIPPLVAHFAARAGPVSRPFDPETLAALERARYPGNVRQLEQVVRLAIAAGPPGTPVALADLPDELTDLAEPLPAGTPAATDRLDQLARSIGAGRLTLEEALQECERWFLAETLEATRRNQTRAARLLGITPRAVYAKLRRLGLER